MEFSPAYTELNSRLSYRRSTRETTTRSSRKSTIAKKKRNEERRPVYTSKYVLLYLDLVKIENLPELRQNLEIGLYHKSGVLKSRKICDDESENIELNKFDYYKPSFTLRMKLDNIENLNILSDEPLVFTLYEHIKPKPKFTYMPTDESYEDDYIIEEEAVAEEAEEEEVEERLVPLAQGYLDLLQMLSGEKINIVFESFLYSIDQKTLPMRMVKTIWQAKSVVPLLKDLKLTNTALIAMESIYNAPEALLNESHNLAVSLSFHATFSKNETRKTKLLKIEEDAVNLLLCQYTNFKNSSFIEQSINMKWEALKDKSVNNLLSVGLQSSIQVKTTHPFEGLVRTEHVDFKFDEINLNEDYIIVSNSLHRFILTDAITQILVDVIAFKEQNILVQLYHIDAPEVILYQGFIDLSILLYPTVNARRFAVELQPIRIKKSQLKVGQRSQSEKLTPPEKPVFIIVSVCLESALTEKPPLKNLTAMHRCTDLFPIEPDPIESLTLCSNFYVQFDKLVQELTDYIIRKNVTDMSEGQAFFCCQLAQMNNLLTGITACDYNSTTHTTNNIEFTRLLPKLYNDLEKRMFNIVRNCKDTTKDSALKAQLTEDQLILLFSMMKYAIDINQNALADTLYEKINTSYGNKFAKELLFYKLIDDVEMNRFDDAIEYLEMETNQDMTLYKFRSIISIYIRYRKIRLEKTESEALGDLLLELYLYAKRNEKDMDGWILLYCYYVKYMYYAGMEFTRQKYEDCFNKIQQVLPNIPISRWRMHIAFVPVVESVKMQHFLRCMLQYTELGLYEFASIIYNQVATECNEPVNYLIRTTLQLLLHELPAKFDTKNMSVDKYNNAMELRATAALVNGHVGIERGNIYQAMQNYERIIQMPLENFVDYKLGLLRYGFYMLEQQRYHETCRALEKLSNETMYNMDAYWGLGRAFYFLHDLNAAEKHFAVITKFRIHLVDAWAYLALINLRLNNIFKALQFWKYAKLYPKKIICNEVLEELSKIEVLSLNLYIDKPKQKYFDKLL